MCFQKYSKECFKNLPFPILSLKAEVCVLRVRGCFLKIASLGQGDIQWLKLLAFTNDLELDPQYPRSRREPTPTVTTLSPYMFHDTWAHSQPLTYIRLNNYCILLVNKRRLNTLTKNRNPGWGDGVIDNTDCRPSMKNKYPHKNLVLQHMQKSLPWSYRDRRSPRTCFS